MHSQLKKSCCLWLLMKTIASILCLTSVVSAQDGVFDKSSPLRIGQSLLKVIQSSQLDIIEEIRHLEEEIQPLRNVSRRLEDQDRFIKSQSKLLEGIFNSLYVPHDCNVFFSRNNKVDKTYRVARNNADVICDMTTPGGPWLVFQRRKDGSVDFYRNWKNYTDGFGDQNGEFWLGNENLYLLTSNGRYKLRVDLEDWEGNKRYAEYSSFSINSSDDYYRLNVSGYSGDAGDGMAWQNGQQFSTIDADHDSRVGENCATMFRGAWWYNNCHTSNLNGLYLRGNTTIYAQGVVWNQWPDHYYSLKTTAMKISRID